MKFQQALNNFTSGEWSPKMLARTETDQYARSCELLENFFVQMQGGAFKRPGFRSVGQFGSTYQGILNNATNLRIFPWVLSDGSKYLIVTTNDRPVTGTNPWFIIDLVASAIYNVTSGSFTSPDLQTANLPTAQYAQVGDLFFFVCGDVIPRTLRKVAGPAFILDTVEQGFLLPIGGVGGGSTVQDTGKYRAVPYGNFNSSGVGGTITVTGTFSIGGAVNLVSSADIFTSAMTAGPTYMRFTSGGNTGVLTITAYTNSQHAAGKVDSVGLPGASGDTYGTASGTAWEMSAWNSSYGWPRTIVPFQGRLIYGGNTNSPDTLWGSEIGNIFQLMEVPLAQAVAPQPTFADYAANNSRPFTIVPNSKEASNIRALCASDTLLVNTDRSEIVAQGAQGALGANDVELKSSTSFGAEFVQPIRINNYSTFVQRGGRKIRDVIFSFQEDQYKSNDLMFVSEHLTSGDPIQELVCAEIGSSIAFARTYKGNLLSVTLDRDYQVNAWSRHTLGGSYSGGKPVVLALASVPANFFNSSQPTDQDQVYALVKRTINGATKVSLEVMARIYNPDDTIQTLTLNGVEYPEYVDYGRHLVNLVMGVPTATTTFTFTDLANETVSVLADGSYIGEFTLNNSGVLTLPTAKTAVLIGYKYTANLQPSPVEQGSQIGTAQGIQKRAHEVFIRLWNTIGGINYGTKLPGTVVNQMYALDIPGATLPVPFSKLATTDTFIKMPSGYSRRYSVLVQSTLPLPCNVLGLALQGMGYDSN